MHETQSHHKREVHDDGITCAWCHEHQLRDGERQENHGCREMLISLVRTRLADAIARVNKLSTSELSELWERLLMLPGAGLASTIEEQVDIDERRDLAIAEMLAVYPVEITEAVAP